MGMDVGSREWRMGGGGGSDDVEMEVCVKGGEIMWGDW